jgi:predicted transcriptional regulator
MITNGTGKTDFTCKVKEILSKEPGLSVKELSDRLSTNRQFMAGMLKALEEHREVTYRQVGPARIYYTTNDSKEKARGDK